MHVDAQLTQLFHHIRRTVDILEHILRSRESARLRSETGVESGAQSPEHLAYSLQQVGELVSVGRSSLYKAIKAGELRAVKQGRRTMVLSDDLRAWLSSLRQH